MRAYCGQTRSQTLSDRLAAARIGECTVRGELLSRMRSPWFYDNGAYRDWKDGREFNSMRFERDMRRISYSHGNPAARLVDDGSPDFVVLPDLVAKGPESLRFTAEWRWYTRDLPSYVAVQDGMTESTVARFLDDAISSEVPYVGLFVGGTLEWKLDTSAAWVRFAHARGLRCHIGRVGVPDRVLWAHEIGADSIDSCLPIMHKHHLENFLAALSVCGGSN